MATSPAEAPAAIFLKIEGDGWVLIEDGRIAVNPELSEDAVHAGPAQTALAVPGEAVTIHWLDLADDLTQAQAAAAARLLLAEASLTTLAEMHVAVGRPEGGLTPVALAPVAAMNEWTASNADIVIPTSLLLVPPAKGLVRRGLDHRGLAQAFSVEPELAEFLTDGQAVVEIDEAAFEAGLADALAEPALNLRQGPFARRRQWKLEAGRTRRLVLLGLVLAALTLIVQIVLILAYTFAADRAEAETAELSRARPASAGTRPGFGPTAALLFEAIRSTPNLEMTRLEYRPDGSLSASLSLDNPATLAAFRARLDASGLAVEGGEITTAAGRPTAELTVRPS